MRTFIPKYLIPTIAICAGLMLALFFVLYLCFGENTPISLGYLGTDAPIDLLEPIWLVGMALVPVFFAVAIHSLTDISRKQQLLSAFLRSAIVAGLFFVLARPVWTNEEDRNAVIVLVDVSKSISDLQIKAAEEYLTQLTEMKKSEDRLIAISFAKHAHRLTDFKDIQRHEGEDEATNLQAAIQQAYTLIPDGYVPQIVVLSDGNETRGNAASEVAKAQALGMRISWRNFQTQRKKEVRLAEIRLPEEIREGAPFFVRGKIISTHKETLSVSLTKDGFPTPDVKSVEVTEGVNWVEFKSVAPNSGFVTYKMKIAPPKEDHETTNNVATMAAPVNGRPHILYVEGNKGRGGRAALTRALLAENFRVDERGPQGVPTTVAALESFDLIFLSDVPAQFVSLAAMNALDSYVRARGGGLVMSGGEDSFGSGGYQGTKLEKLMPVRFDSETTREQPNVAIILVVDRSGSMQGAKIEAAKESARATAEVLSPTDMVGVIAFDNQPSTIVRLQRASNRARISSDIGRLTASGGTNILPALNEAYETLQTANAKVKHVILLSDGQAPYDGISSLAQEMRSANITVSAVGIGDADRNLLQMISSEGDGRLYMVEDIAALPRIFMKETTEAKKSALVEDLVRVRVRKNADLIEGTGVGNSPPLRGYVSTKSKPSSEVILASDLGEPLLARWRVGAGQTVAWTSDVKNRWAVEWVRWSNFPKFWAQVIRASMRNKVFQSFDLSVAVQGERTKVVIDAVDAQGNFVNGLESELQVLDPKNGVDVQQRFPMVQTSAGRYTADFDVAKYGAYRLRVVQKRAGKPVAVTLGAAALPYPEEYLRTSLDSRTLSAMALTTGGLEQPDPAKVLEPTDVKVTFREELWPWLLLVLAGLLVLDTYLKRIRIFGYRTMRV